jgi:parallel beta-helix repeat protein
MKLTYGVAICVFAFGPFLRPGYGGSGSVNAHAPIVIQSDADFTNCACVLSGAGTQASPFIIGPWAINNATGNGVLIDGTKLTKSFVLMNLTIAGNGSSTSQGIMLSNINPKGIQSIVAAVQGAQTSIQTANVGIVVESSHYVTLDGGGENPNGAGIGNAGAGTINKNMSGAIDIESSSHIVVEGWQMSASGGDHQVDWVTLDPSIDHWGVGGVRMFGVTNSLIDHNAVNNCTNVSFSLFKSNGNTVSNNTADYPFTMNFIVTDGSSYNVISNNVASTGDFFGYVVADPLPKSPTLATYGPSHDNVFTGNISHTDGPTGNEVNANVVPAFLGGFVVLNGTYNNQITGNQDWASTGGGFVWAQAVPDSTSPIGVITHPPPLHCNVTASEGGGGVAKLNGNVWKGNVFQTIDPCLPPQ